MTDKEPQPDEFIWANDFNSRTIASEVAWLGIKTYGELAELSPGVFEDTRLDNAEINVVESLLARKGFPNRQFLSTDESPHE